MLCLPFTVLFTYTLRQPLLYYTEHLLLSLMSITFSCIYFDSYSYDHFSTFPGIFCILPHFFLLPLFFLVYFFLISAFFFFLQIMRNTDPVTGEVTAKLLDFGLSKNAGAGSSAKTFVGTPCYLGTRFLLYFCFFTIVLYIYFFCFCDIYVL
jgi:hypothetical protein